MYAPAPFRNTDRETARALIEEIRLGTVFTAAGGLEASLLPFMIERDQGPLGRLVGHCARANPQWNSLDDGTEVLVSFLGPHAYVSPGWYGTHPRAPTWLYASVQVRGTSRLVDTGATREMIVRLSNEMEPQASTWSPDNIGSYIEKLLPAIVGFHIDITDIQTTLRLAQQNGIDDRRRVHRVLKGGDLSQQLVSQLMDRFTVADQTAAV